MDKLSHMISEEVQKGDWMGMMVDRRGLAIALTRKSPRQNDFHRLMEQVRSKLTNWKGNQLSFA